LLLFVFISLTLCCTNFLITKGASVEGYNMITYNADANTLFGALYYFPAADYKNGTMMDIYDWDTEVYIGQIPQALHTYNVVGNMNEYALSIGETTYGGLAPLQSQPGSLIDYGSLIWITLQRSKNAREAIKTMGSLVAQYGYYSEGESFSIADPNEVWVMEMIGKGSFEKGAVWVAQRIPDGYVCAHANQARITSFPLNDPDNCIYSPDVITFAKKHGFYPAEQADSQFSFSDVYDPVAFGGARFCEARVYSFFRNVKSGIDNQYLDYAQGYNLTNRMPLWIKPDRKISLNDTFTLMRDHYEGTWLQLKDVGGEAFNMQYRWKPLTWSYGGSEYLNERPTSTQQTGWSFVAQLRSNMPSPIGGILWFGVDDSSLTVHVPMYCGMKSIPNSFSDEIADMMTFSFSSAFWVFNLVNNYVYTRQSVMYPEVYQEIVKYEKIFLSSVSHVDKVATTLYNNGDIDEALNFITNFSVNAGNQVVSDWLVLFQKLFTKYMDGNRKYRSQNSKIPKVEYPGYPDAWYQRIVQETGDHYKVAGGKKSDSKLNNKKIF